MTKYIFLTFVAVTLAACGSAKPRGVEMPASNNLEGTNVQRISPCACVEYTEFNNLFGEAEV